MTERIEPGYVPEQVRVGPLPLNIVRPVMPLNVPLWVKVLPLTVSVVLPSVIAALPPLMRLLTVIVIKDAPENIPLLVKLFIVVRLLPFSLIVPALTMLAGAPQELVTFHVGPEGTVMVPLFVSVPPLKSQDTDVSTVTEQPEEIVRLAPFVISTQLIFPPKVPVQVSVEFIWVANNIVLPVVSKVPFWVTFAPKVIVVPA